MAEQEQVSSESQVSSNESQGSETPQSLDQVYKQFNVEADAQDFSPRREVVRETVREPAQPAQQSATANVPDPVLDPAGYKTWVSQQTEFTQKALSSLQGELTQLRAERIRAREEADIKSAVQKFKTVTGDDVDDDVAEIALGQKARKDPKFLSVYQNRGRNPKAWDAAVAAYANEFKGKHTFKVDPQIAENQRAAKQSTQGSQTTQKDDVSGDEARFKGKHGTQFANEWSRYVNSTL